MLHHSQAGGAMGVSLGGFCSESEYNERMDKLRRLKREQEVRRKKEQEVRMAQEQEYQRQLRVEEELMKERQLEREAVRQRGPHTMPSPPSECTLSTLNATDRCALCVCCRR